jgi:hypothetical protein
MMWNVYLGLVYAKCESRDLQKNFAPIGLISGASSFYVLELDCRNGDKAVLNLSFMVYLFSL